jgi:hypothetical protein
MWSYEKALPHAISTLAIGGAHQLSAEIWLRVLVPFVASLFVRGPEFNRRFESRSPIRDLQAFYGLTGFRDNTNMARLMEMQRLLFPIMCAEWTLAFCGGSGTLVTNDIGYSLLIDPASGEPAYVVPLCPSMTLKLNKGRSCLQMCWTGERWAMQGIAHATLFPEGVTNVNTSMAAMAIREIYGPTEAVVESCTSSWRSANRVPVPTPGPLYLTMDARTMQNQELTWHRMVSVLAGPPQPDAASVFNMR